MKLFGAPYPITKHPMGFLRAETGIDQVKADLLILLLTNPGERVMLPTFGTPLRKLHFEPNDPALRSQARQMIINSIQQWEPRIVVDAIEVIGTETNSLSSNDLGQDLDYILTIKISFYDPQNIQAVQDLTLQLPLANAVENITSTNAVPLIMAREVNANEV